jgi:protein ImuA
MRTFMQNTLKKISHARHLLAGVENSWRDAGGSGWTASLMVPVIDGSLSVGGITAPSLHEIHGCVGNAAASGFALWLAERTAARTAKTIFWITAPKLSDSGTLYPPALRAHLNDRLIVVEAGNRHDVLWAFEEILTSGQAGAVIAETSDINLTAGRRLQLASERGQSLAIALCRTGQETGSSAARTRWRVGTCREGWNLELLGGRGVRPGEWKVKYDAAALSLHLVPPSGDGSKQPPKRHVT